MNIERRWMIVQLGPRSLGSLMFLVFAFCVHQKLLLQLPGSLSHSWKSNPKYLRAHRPRSNGAYVLSRFVSFEAAALILTTCRTPRCPYHESCSRVLLQLRKTRIRGSED